MRLENEIWAPIEGYEDLYHISNLGRVKSLPKTKHKGCIMQLRDNLYGYLTVGLYKDGKIKRVKVHRLVATHFIPNINGYTQVNHIDGDKHNNAYFNLEWCDRSHNMLHAYANGLCKVTPVDQYTMDGHFIKTWKSGKEAGDTLHIPKSNINKCCKGERFSAGGYVWIYTKKDDV